LVLFSAEGVFGQSSELPFSLAYKSKTELDSYFDFALGYVPKSEYNALLGRVSVNDVIFKRLGAYTAFEKGLDSSHFSNTIGGTITVFPFLNIWGGFDMYSLFVLKEDQEFVRKEIGVGIFPYKNFVAHIGYSVSVGPTFAFGYKIPL
jgi:hypothetical protein